MAHGAPTATGRGSPGGGPLGEYSRRSPNAPGCGNGRILSSLPGRGLIEGEQV